MNRFVTLAISALLVLTGCQAAPSPSGSTPTATGATMAESPSARPDPRTVEGTSEVSELGDVTPIGPAPTPTLPVTLTDDRGRQVTVTDTSRIITLDITGTLSRTVAGLGLGSRIVGRAVTSTEPALAALPVVSHGPAVNVETIVALHPSVVLTDASIGPETALEQIDRAGIPVIYVNQAANTNQITEKIEQVGRFLGVQDAGKQLADRTRAQIDDATAYVSQAAPATPMRGMFIYARGTGVFLIVGKESTASFFDGIAVEDLAAKANITSMAPATAEALVDMDPEVIFVMRDALATAGGVDGLLAKPGISQTTAGRQRRLVIVPDGQALSRGPQYGQNLRLVAESVYGANR